MKSRSLLNLKKKKEIKIEEGSPEDSNNASNIINESKDNIINNLDNNERKSSSGSESELRDTLEMRDTIDLINKEQRENAETLPV